MVEHECARYACPLLFPQRTGASCPLDHANWPKGCITTLPTSPGNYVRHTLDRKSEAYLNLYKQRSATERINSQALEIGIERPKLRNQRSITNQDTLIYVLINLRALQRVRQLKAEQAKTTTDA
ncbi:MAG: transposase [Caldilineaceae bacterium]